MTAPIETQSAAERARLLDLIHGYRSTCIVVAALELGLVDALDEGVGGVGELAPRLGVDAAALARLLRAMAAVGLVEPRAGEARLTALGRLLADRDAGLRERAVLAGREYVPAWGALARAVATGEPAYDHVFGMGAWERRRRHPELNACLNRTMADDQRRVAGAIAAAYDFSHARRIVDVGGGEGALLADILSAHPQPAGTLFDQPHVVAGAAAVLAAAGVAARCEIVGGSFFDAVPEGGDVYVLQHVLHNWDDARASAILRRCRAAMGERAVLLVVENLLPDAAAASAHVALLDLHMLVMLGGRERSREEYAALLREAGFALARSLPTRAAVAILEARPA